MDLTLSCFLAVWLPPAQGSITVELDTRNPHSRDGVDNSPPLEAGLVETWCAGYMALTRGALFRFFQAHSPSTSAMLQHQVNGPIDATLFSWEFLLVRSLKTEPALGTNENLCRCCANTQCCENGNPWWPRPFEINRLSSSLLPPHLSDISARSSAAAFARTSLAQTQKEQADPKDSRRTIRSH